LLAVSHFLASQPLHRLDLLFNQRQARALTFDLGAQQ
jgi:hypothetical protein